MFTIVSLWSFRKYIPKILIGMTGAYYFESNYRYGVIRGVENDWPGHEVVRNIDDELLTY